MAFTAGLLILIGIAIIAGTVLYFRRASANETVLVGESRLGAEPSREIWDEDLPAVFVDEDAPVAPVIAAAGVTWPAKIQRFDNAPDAEARLRLLRDLGMLRAAWCVPILELACEEETDPNLRTAAQDALAKCRRVDPRTPPPPTSNGHAELTLPLPPTPSP